jgi:hypothetical protein
VRHNNNGWVNAILGKGVIGQNHNPRTIFFDCCRSGFVTNSYFDFIARLTRTSKY